MKHKEKLTNAHLVCLVEELSVLQKTTFHIFMHLLDTSVPLTFCFVHLLSGPACALCFLHCPLTICCLPAQMKLFPGPVTSTETNTRRKTEIVYCFSRDACAAVFKLVDFQWKLGMAVSSDRCRSLKYPYVAVKLKVADPSGQVNTKTIEMTIPQFQVCSGTH